MVIRMIRYYGVYMKNLLFVSVLVILGSFSLQAQTTDSLTLNWDASVAYGSFGQRTVVVNDTLWHVGGRFFYGTPFGVAHWEQSFVEFLAPGTGYWEIDTTTTAYRFYGNAEVFEDKIYILGGGGAAPLSVEIFHPATRSITLGAEMPAHHRNAGSALYDGKIYMIAGSNDTDYNNRLDIYDIANDTWTTGAAFPVAMQTEAVLVGDKIYTMGGFDGTVHDEIFEYDIANDSWSQVGAMPSPTSAHRLVAHNGYVYVVGDYADLDRLMRYNTVDGSWTIYESNLIGRRHASTAIKNDLLYILGGNSNHNGTWQYYNLVQTLDLSSVVSIASDASIRPSSVLLKQNFPNPFNPTTSIRFFLEQANDVELTIYNLKGQQVRQLHAATLPFGEHEIVWDGRNDSGKDLASGQYMYSLRTGNDVQSKKMLLLR